MGYLDGSGLSYLWRKIRSAIGAQATPRNLLDNSDFTHPIAQAWHWRAARRGCICRGPLGQDRRRDGIR